MAIICRRYGPPTIAVQPGYPYKEGRDHDVERWRCSEERGSAGHVEQHSAGHDNAFDGYFARHGSATEEVVDADACFFDSKGASDGHEKRCYVH